LIHMRRFALISFFLLACLIRAEGAVGSRIKDLTTLSGQRDNQLVGYGLVVGLAGDGDKDPVYTVNSIANMLHSLGITIPSGSLSSKNVAAVIVTADIPAFLRKGSRIDVTLGAMGDAKSLQGGMLVQCPLFGADGKVYAVAQGTLAVGGFIGGASGAGGGTVQKNHPTVAQISGGALVEEEIETDVVKNNSIDLLLREPDFATASRMSSVINAHYTNVAIALDSTTVRVQVPDDEEGDHVAFIARVQELEVMPDTPARIVINERTGTIVATAQVRISACAVSHGALSISITGSQDVSQPNPGSRTGNTAVTSRTDTKINESKVQLITLQDMPTVDKVAAGLNAIGVTPRDMMAIFQAMKQAGALQAELVLR